jgi:glucose/arabinose dehydrogenase
MKKSIVGYLLAISLLVGCSINERQDTPLQDVQQSNDRQKELSLSEDKVEVIAENLDAPWSIDKIDDTFYVTERQGSIVKIVGNEIVRQSVELEKEISTASEAGLLGFVLAPDFLESNQAYAYYTYEGNEGQFSRIVILQLEDNVWREESLLADQIPSGTYHHGGRLQIGPDDKLYAPTGDASDREIAQNLDSLGGKILRMNLDGSIPDDNPFSGSYIYSYGHRNPQGITWSSNSTMYASEHGNNANDEVNLIEVGQNYGWPIIEGNEERENLISPLFTSGSEATWAPSGMDYRDGRLYVAALRGSAVLEFNLETGEFREVINGLGRIRDVFIERHHLYFISNNSDGRGNPQANDDRLYRIHLSQFD